MVETVLQKMPLALRDFIEGNCGLSGQSFWLIEPSEMPQPQRRLLCHDTDMTSTLSAFHGSALQVDALRKRKHQDTYIREVYLKTIKGGEIVEYGVIAIFLQSFEPEQRKVIVRDRKPLGGLLHQFEIEFISAPLCFFSLSQSAVARNPMAGFGQPKYYGRFNELAKPNGQSLAWIMEILPKTISGGPL